MRVGIRVKEPKKVFGKLDRKMNFSRLIVDILFILLILIDGYYCEPLSGDYRGYLSSYNHADQIDDVFEFGYAFSQMIFHRIGLSFFQFRFILVIITLLLMRNSILTYSKKPVILTLLFFFQPFLLEVIQIRNALSIAIVIYALRYVTYNKNIERYIFLLLIAFLFHQSSILYVVFILAAKNDIYKVRTQSLVIIGSLLLFCSVLQEIITFIFGFFISSVKINMYLNNPQPVTSRNFIIWYVSFYLILILFSYSGRGIVMAEGKWIKICMLILSCCPLLILHYDYYRVIDYLMPIIYLVFSNIVFDGKKYIQPLTRIAGWIGFLACVAYSLYNCRVWGNQTGFSVIHNNLFLDHFGI